MLELLRGVHLHSHALVQDVNMRCPAGANFIPQGMLNTCRSVYAGKAIAGHRNDYEVCTKFGVVHGPTVSP